MNSLTRIAMVVIAVVACAANVQAQVDADDARELQAGDPLETLYGGHYALRTPHMACSVSRKTGPIIGIWDGATGQRYVANSYDTYHLETRQKQWRATEKEDIVTDAPVVEPDRLIVECKNAKIPGAAIEKAYFFAEARGEKRILCRRIRLMGTPDQFTVFTSTSNTTLDDDYLQDAVYYEVFPQALMRGLHSSIAPTDIERPIARADHPGDQTGRAACEAFNQPLRTGFAQYLYKVRDHWAYPWAMSRQTYWIREGWRLGGSGFGINADGHSMETRYHLFYGDRLQFYFEYLELPELKALREQTKPLPIMKHVVSPGRGTRDLRPGDLTVDYEPLHRGRGQETGFEFGVFANRDDVVLVQHDRKNIGNVLQRIPAPELKKRFAEQRVERPHALLGVYFYRNYPSQITASHPDWFYRPLEDMLPPKSLYWYPGWEREPSDFLAEGMAGEVEYLGTGLLYLDSNISPDMIDWRNERVSHNKVYYWQRLFEELHKRGALLWANMHSGSVFYDIAHYECSGAHGAPGKTWRDGADMDLINKISQIEGTMHVPLYWWASGPLQNSQDYQNHVLALAVSPFQGPYLQRVDGTLPVRPNDKVIGVAADEYRDARFVRIGLEPAWWNDSETTLEAYTLKLGDTYFVNAISHAEQPADIAVTVDLKKMGFDPAKRTFIWQHQLREVVLAGHQYPDDIIGKAFRSRTMTSLVPKSSKLMLTLATIPVQSVRVCAITQVPAFIYSADNIPTQTLLPETLQCSIRGSVDEKRRHLSVTVTATRPIEVLAYWPTDWGRANVTAREDAGAETTVTARSMSLGSESFALFALPKGDWNVTLRQP